MDRSNTLYSFSTAFGGFILSSAELSYPGSATEQQLLYQGMQVQTVESPISYVNHIVTDQNPSGLTRLLDQYQISPSISSGINAALTERAAAKATGILEENNNDNLDDIEPSFFEDLDDIESSFFEDLDDIEPSFFEDLDDIEPKNVSNTESELAYLPALPNRQSSRQVAVVNMQQVTDDSQANTAEQIAGNNSSERERKKAYQREHRKDPEVRERERAYQIERRKDPEIRERERAYQSERRKDPEIRDRERESQRAYQKEHRKVSGVREREREYQRAHQKERRKDRERECRKDSGVREREQNDPAHAEGTESI